MKLKTKLLSIVAPAAVLTTVAPIALTSCNNDEGGGQTTNTITYVGESKSITTKLNPFSMEFKLGHNLSSGQTLEASVRSTGGDIACAPKSTTVNGTKVIVSVEIIQPGLVPAYGTGTLVMTFTCTNATHETIWTKVSDQFTITYTK